MVTITRIMTMTHSTADMAADSIPAVDMVAGSTPADPAAVDIAVAVGTADIVEKGHGGLARAAVSGCLSLAGVFCLKSARQVGDAELVEQPAEHGGFHSA